MFAVLPFLTTKALGVFLEGLAADGCAAPTSLDLLQELALCRAAAAELAGFVALCLCTSGADGLRPGLHGEGSPVLWVLLVLLCLRWPGVWTFPSGLDGHAFVDLSFFWSEEQMAAILFTKGLKCKTSCSYNVQDKTHMKVFCFNLLKQLVIYKLGSKRKSVVVYKTTDIIILTIYNYCVLFNLTVY